MLITPKTLTGEAFLPFGEVIEASAEVENFAINDGYTQRYHNLAKVDVNTGGGQAAMSIFRSTPLSLPIKIEKMERHPLSSQAFMPLSGRHYLVVVAPPVAFAEDRLAGPDGEIKRKPTGASMDAKCGSKARSLNFGTGLHSGRKSLAEEKTVSSVVVRHSWYGRDIAGRITTSPRNPGGTDELKPGPGTIMATGVTYGWQPLQPAPPVPPPEARP